MVKLFIGTVMQVEMVSDNFLGNTKKKQMWTLLLRQSYCPPDSELCTSVVINNGLHFYPLVSSLFFTLQPSYQQTMVNSQKQPELPSVPFALV